MKKLLLIGLVAAGVVVAAKGVGVLHRVKSEATALRTWVADNEPVDEKIAHLRTDVAALDKDIQKATTALATEIVDVRELTHQVSEKRAALDSEKKALLARGETLKDATERVKFGSAFLSVPDARERLQRDVKLFTKREAELAAREKVLAHREQIKATLEKQLDGLKKQKEEMLVEIEGIEAEYRTLQLQQIESRYQHDDTRLSKVKEQIRDLRKKIDVEKTKLELAPVVHAEEPTVSPSATVDDILAPLTGVSK